MAAISARSRVGWASRVLARRFAFSDTSFQGSVSFGIAGGNGCTGHAGALLSQLGAHHATRTAPGVSAKPTMSSTGRCGPLDLTKPLGVQRPWANLYRVHTVSFLGRRSLEFRRPFVVPQRAGGEFSGSGGGWDRDGGDRRQQYRFRQYQGWEGDGPKPPLWTLLRNPLLFSGAFTLGSFAVAAIYRDESRRSAPVFENPFTRTPRRRKTHEILGMQFTTAEVVVWSIIGANCAVSLAWLRSMRGQYSHLHAYPWLQRYFLHHPFSGRGAPLLFSAFSHNTGPHLVFNMLALYSFAPGIIQALGPENFLASYMSACVLSSLGGMAIKLATTSTVAPPFCAASLDSGLGWGFRSQGP